MRDRREKLRVRRVPLPLREKWLIIITHGHSNHHHHASYHHHHYSLNTTALSFHWSSLFPQHVISFIIGHHGENVVHHFQHVSHHYEFTRAYYHMSPSIITSPPCLQLARVLRDNSVPGVLRCHIWPPFCLLACACYTNVRPNTDIIVHGISPPVGFMKDYRCFNRCSSEKPPSSTSRRLPSSRKVTALLLFIIRAFARRPVKWFSKK